MKAILKKLSATAIKNCLLNELLVKESLMKLLITGSAGFIGTHLAMKLSQLGHEVVGVDNLTPMPDLKLKYARLSFQGIKILGTSKNRVIDSKTGILFAKADLKNSRDISWLFSNWKFDCIIHLAGRPGVRNSIKEPHKYIEDNLFAFLNILEGCSKYRVDKLIFASSSSVYGDNDGVASHEFDRTDHPLSLYAATKKSNECMAYTYCHNYKINCIGLRFFTVYGPWGRPDMSMSIFTDRIMNGLPIDLYNYGNQTRDFTAVADIADGVSSIVAYLKSQNTFEYDIVNIGYGRNVDLLEMVKTIENKVGQKAIINKIASQQGDVKNTLCDNSKLRDKYNFVPKINIYEGISDFINWYKWYKELDKKAYKLI